MTHRDPTQIVREFYHALNAGDASRVSLVVRERFAADVSITWADSFPFGGTRSGRDRLAAFFGRLAATTPPRGAVDIEVLEVIAQDGSAAVRLIFDWVDGAGERRPNGAVEWWTFDDDGAVTSIRPYYWDGPAIASAP